LPNLPRDRPAHEGGKHMKRMIQILPLKNVLPGLGMEVNA